MCKIYLENQETLLRKIKDLYKERNMPYSSTQRVNIIKLSVLSKSSYRFYSISVKISARCCGNWKDDSVFFYDMQKARNSQDNLEEKNRVERFTLLDGKIKKLQQLSQYGIHTKFYQLKNKIHKQTNRTREFRKRSTHVQTFKLCKWYHCKVEEKGLSFQNGADHLAIHMEKPMPRSPYLIPVTKLSAKRSVDINWKDRTLKLPEDN